MGMKNSVPNFWDWEWEWKTVFPKFGIGNGNEKQCCQPNLENNWLNSLGKKLGTGIPDHPWGMVTHCVTDTSVTNKQIPTGYAHTPICLFHKIQVSVKATVTNPKSSVEKLSPKESPKDAHTILRGAAPKDSVNCADPSPPHPSKHDLRADFQKKM